MKVWKTSLVLLVGLGGAASASDGQAEPKERLFVLRSRVRSLRTEAALERAGRAALRRLEQPECQRVLSDFTDAQGRTLRENLDALGQTAPTFRQSCSRTAATIGDVKTRVSSL